MGMAASQARLLMLTARIHDTEYQAQQIQSAKLQLATQEDEVYRKYNEALDATTLTFTNDNKEIIPATFNNLCGLSSINNGMNKKYVFRTGDDDKLIVPDEVFKGYSEYGGNSPYEFAMYMLGINKEDLNKAENEYVQGMTSGSSEPSELEKLKADLHTRLLDIEDKTGKKGLAKEVEENGEEIRESYNMARTGVEKEDVNKAIDEYLELESQYKYKLYQKGAESIYKKANGEEAEFDKDKYQYYMRWGTLIENEVGIRYCVSESDYSEGFGSDGELLQQMLQSGRITVDTVEIDKSTGKLTDKTTSVATDQSLNYTTTSTIDKTAVAKAEAEYEFAMKKIDQKDKKYDMELNKLETERTALTKEYDSVKKVVQENIERTFGIFS